MVQMITIIESHGRRHQETIDGLTQNVRRCKGQVETIRGDLQAIRHKRPGAASTTASLRAALNQQLADITADRQDNERLRQRLREDTAATAAEADKLRRALAGQFLIVGSGATVRFAQRLGVKAARATLQAKGKTVLAEFQRLEVKHADLLERQDVAEQQADELVVREVAVGRQLATVDAELPRLRPGLRSERAAARAEWVALQAVAGPLRQAQLAELQAAGRALRKELTQVRRRTVFSLPRCWSTRARARRTDPPPSAEL